MNKSKPNRPFAGTPHARRRIANRELLAHARWQIALAVPLQQCYLCQATPLLRVAFPYLPLLFGRRAKRSDRLRQRVTIVRRRFA